MRCPSCGTQNEPDSRFCGGCGARLSGALPPTQKIDTGAQPVQAPAQVVGQRTPSVATPPPASVPPASYPMTPSVQRPPSKPPTANGAATATPAPVAQSMQPRASQESIAPPRRRTGLIVGVLLVDLALAASGAYLLAQGLAEPAPAPVVKSSAVVPAAAAPVAATGPAPVITPDAAIVTVTPIEDTPAPAKSAAVVDEPVAPPPPTTKKARPAKAKAKPKTQAPGDPAAPLDPYALDEEPPPPPPPPPPGSS